jgi:N6-adenosine-specific RNA methylase IME4
MLDQVHARFESGPFAGLPREHYRVALIPWKSRAWSHRGEGKGACQHYRTRTLEEIVAPVTELMAADSAMFLWVTQPMLPEALRVLEAWEFTYRTVAFVWIKMPSSRRAGSPRIRPRLGLGYHTCSGTEQCWLAIRGKGLQASASVEQVLFAPLEHSRKPDEVARLIDVGRPSPTQPIRERRMKILGCDPDIRGGIAIVETNDGAAPKLIDAIDVPTIGNGAKERVDVLALRTWIRTQRPDHAAIERGQALPRQGSSSGYKYGRSVGSLEATITCCEIPLTIVEPALWKRALRLHGKDKEGARQLALQRFPSAHALLARKKDHQRAEAALIALHASGGAP